MFQQQIPMSQISAAQERSPLIPPSLPSTEGLSQESELSSIPVFRVVPERRGQLHLELCRFGDVAIALVLLLAVLLGTNLNRMPLGLEEFLLLRITVKNLLLLGSFAGFWYALFALFGLYDFERIRTWRDEFIAVLFATTAGSVFSFSFALTSASGSFRFSTVSYFWFVVTLCITAERYLLRRLPVKPRHRTARRALIVGSGPRANRLYRELSSGSRSTYTVLGFVDSNEGAVALSVRQRMLGGLGDLERILMRNVVDTVLIALPIKSCYGHIQDAIHTCERVGVEVKYLADVFQYSLAKPRFDPSVPFSAITLTLVPDDYRLWIKRTVDMVGGVIGLLALAPVMAIIAVAIKLTSPGPIFFVQERYGLNKRRFKMYKFRTMVTEAEELQASLEALNEATGPVFKIRHDPRITPIGAWLRKTSLDELPQLWNVVRGEMSLVGPRPLPTRDVSNFAEAWPMRRFSVLPGLTCLWQISGRSDLGFTEWMQLDLHYIDQWSLMMDLKILARTLPVVVHGTGAA